MFPSPLLSLCLEPLCKFKTPPSVRSRSGSLPGSFLLDSDLNFVLFALFPPPLRAEPNRAEPSRVGPQKSAKQKKVGVKSSCRRSV